MVPPSAARPTTQPDPASRTTEENADPSLRGGSTVMLGFLRALLRLPETRSARRYPRRPPNSFTEDGKPHYQGHRARLRKRFLATKPDGLPDYELLELVLCNAIQKIDIKPLAKKLLARFGSINAVVAAPETPLREVPGVDDWVVLHPRLAGALAQRLARNELAETCVLGSSSALIAYYRTTVAFRDREQFRVLYLDQRNTLIEGRVFAEDTVNAALVYPREVARQGLALNAVSVILMHNHPSENVEPSGKDVAMTRRVIDVCAGQARRRRRTRRSYGRGGTDRRRPRLLRLRHALYRARVARLAARSRQDHGGPARRRRDGRRRLA